MRQPSFFTGTPRPSGRWFLLFMLMSMGTAGNAWAQFHYSGSDTVEPVINAAVLAFERGHAGYKLPIQSTGTTVGIKELCSGKTAMAGASRPIKLEETRACSAAGVQVSEIPVALDAIALAVSVKNTWLKDLTVAEVQNLFSPASAGKLVSWKQVRPTFPDVPIRPAGPNIKHGTFSSFSESMGLNGFIRSDYKDFTHHEKTARFVADTAGAIGFMPFGDAVSMAADLRMVAIDFGAGPVIPSAAEVLSGKYDKLSRTVYLYVNLTLLAKAEPLDVEFSKFLVKDLEKFVRFANLIPLRSSQYQENLKRVSMSR